MEIDHSNHVWSINITYIPVNTDWLYLVAIMDWYSQNVLDWHISDSVEISLVLEANRAALRKVAPEIMNSDQEGHFTNPQYTESFLEAGARINMDQRGRAYDNIFIERLWRTVKYENMYPQAYKRPSKARMGIHRYLCYYHQERPHSRLK